VKAFPVSRKRLTASCKIASETRPANKPIIRGWAAANNAFQSIAAQYRGDILDNCIFCKIVAGTIPSKKVFEDEDLIVFHDINPAAPMHLLMVPREHIATLADSDDRHQALLGKMLLIASKLAKEHGGGYQNGADGPTGGFKTLINTGPDGGQEVYHLHFHLMGGPRPWSGQR
jgi:histidine triad (HIT) family protein